MTLNNYLHHRLDRKNRGIYFKKGKWVIHVVIFIAMYAITVAKLGGKIDEIKGESKTTVVYESNKGSSTIKITGKPIENYIDGSTFIAGFISILPFLLFFYFYCLYLIPACFKRNRKKLFWQLLAGSLIGCSLLQVLLHYAFVGLLPQLGRYMDDGAWAFTWYTFRDFAGIFFGFTTMLFFMELLEEVRTSKDIHAHEHEINITELNRIKMQMNPSFMASSLDKISCLAATQDDKAPEAIVGFADVLRYRLYRSKIDKVFLEEELQQLSNLFKFQNNINSRPCCTLEVEGDTKNKGIPPLALINIAEPLINAASNDTWHLMMYLLCEDDEMQIAIEYTDAGEVAADVLTAMKNTLDLMFGIDVIFATEKEIDNYSLRICLPLHRSSIALS